MSTPTPTRPAGPAPSAPPSRAANAPAGTAGALTTIGSVAARTSRKVLRTPQVLGVAVLQSVLFLVMFRYVLGGAIGGSGDSYVDYLVPGVVVSGLVFTAGGGAVAVAEEAAAGLYDRLRSLPVPDLGVVVGRAVADGLLLLGIALVTLGIGFAIGFRSDADAAHWAAAVGLVVLFSLAVATAFVWIGLASGSAQAANGLSLLGVPLSFLSSAFVPISSMPDMVQAFAEWQPLTFFINAWRGLLVGDPVTSTFEHSLTFYVLGSVAWSLALLAVMTPLALRSYRTD